ncbi:N-acetyltransferase family protein [Defluviitalea saccharophila]|uniref:GNAT family N-acetyltransferase n=1 Tax=Defluviitalea saccharophila TaxID=879970 RepID=A0ABZ2Y9N2_9FIRM|nr:N-acetyltransferase [Candidatus Epulonipiscium sp.]
MNISIRRATPKDIESITKIYNDAISNSTATFDLEEKTLEDRKQWFQEHDDRYPIIVAEYDGTIVGYGCLSSFRPKRAYESSVEHSVYIHKDFRGKGIGSSLLGELIKLASELKYHVMVAVITEGNEDSIRLHKKFNFKYAGALKEIGYKFNQWQSIVFYQLFL